MENGEDMEGSLGWTFSITQLYQWTAMNLSLHVVESAQTPGDPMNE